jgi:hypothetical protein
MHSIKPFIDYALCVETHSLTALGVLGSRASESYSENSDLDLIGFGSENIFKTFNENGIFVELLVKKSVSELKSNPSRWYALKEVVPVNDPNSQFDLMKTEISSWESNYSTPPEIMKNNEYWLESLRRKLTSENSEQQKVFLINTSLWELLSSFFIKNNNPVPGNSHMFSLAPPLIGTKHFNGLVSGNPAEKIASALSVIEHSKSI